MFSLIFHTIQLAVRMAGFAAYYAPPLLILSTLAFFFNLHFLPPWHINFATIIGVMIFAAPYVAVTLQAMLHPYEAPPSFWRGVLLQPDHIDFMVFITCAFMLLGLVMLTMFDAALFFSETVGDLQEKNTAAQAASYSFQRSSILLLLFGSQAATIIAAVIAIMLWFYFFRSILRMPAHVNGYDISSEEAMDLTRHAKWKIFLSSWILNGAVAAGGLWLLPWKESPLWLQSIYAAAGVLVILHVNISFSVVLYQTITPGYTMRKRRGSSGKLSK